MIGASLWGAGAACGVVLEGGTLTSSAGSLVLPLVLHTLLVCAWSGVVGVGAGS